MSKPFDRAVTNVGPNYRGPILCGLIATGALVVGLGLLGGVAQISGAVIAPGVVAAEGRTKKVQHQDGGIIAKISVDDGTEVKEGEVLLRLDDVQIRAQRGVALKMLMQFEARMIRLRAERDRIAEPTFPVATSADQRDAVDVERAQFLARRDGLQRAKSMLDQQIAAKLQERTALQAEQKAISDLERIAKSQQVALSKVYQYNHSKMLQLDREKTELKGRFEQRAADLARVDEQLAELRLKIIQAENEFEREVLKELSTIEDKAREVVEKKDGLDDKLARVDVKSPATGVVHQMAFFTTGAVIRPAETIMNIVPRNERLIIEARVAPTDIDQVSVGQAVVVRFVNFNRRTTPELAAKVTVVSGDVAFDMATRGANPTVGVAPKMSDLPYYAVRIELLDGELKKLDGGHLVPGMQVHTFIATGERRVLSYLTKPLADRFQHAMRER